MAIVFVEAIVLHLVLLFESGPYFVGCLEVSLVSYFYKDLGLRYSEQSVLMELLGLIPRGVSRSDRSVSIG